MPVKQREPVPGREKIIEAFRSEFFLGMERCFDIAAKENHPTAYFQALFEGIYGSLSGFEDNLKDLSNGEYEPLYSDPSFLEFVKKHSKDTNKKRAKKKKQK